MIDAAIVGLGWWGRVHVDSIQGKSERLRYIRAVTKEPELVRDLAAEHDLPLTTEYEDVLRDPAVQAVVLVTPHSLHTDQIVAATEMGKHVFCEKPFALRRTDAERAIRACNDAGVVLGVGQNRRFWPAIVEIGRMIKAGELGTIMHVEGNYSHDILADIPAGSWRVAAEETPAGGMTGMGVHLTDAYLHLVGPVDSVHAFCVDRVLGRPSGDTVSVLLKFENGATGYIGTTLKTAFLWHLRVLGSEGWAETYDENEVTLCKRGGSPEKRSLTPVDSVLTEIEAFADAIEGRAPFPIPQAQIVQNVSVLEAVFEAVATGETVKVQSTSL
jgi:predicted dehydrogenase